MVKERTFNVFATALCALCAMPVFADGVSAISPDGRNEIRLYARPLAYEVFRDGVTVAAKSEIGMTVDGSRMDGADAQDSVHPAVTTGRRNGVADAPVSMRRAMSRPASICRSTWRPAAGSS